MLVRFVANLLPHHQHEETERRVPNHLFVVHSEFADSHIYNGCQKPVGVGNYGFFELSSLSSEPVEGLTLYKLFSFSITVFITCGNAPTSMFSAQS